MDKKLILLTTILTVLVSCNQTGKEVNNRTTENKQSIDTNLNPIKLDFDFIVTVGQEEYFETFKTYTFFQLTRKNSTIYVDSSLTEYEFGDKIFPLVLKTGDNSFELLFEVNDRPSKNYLIRLFIQDNKLTGQDKLPTFEAKSIDINEDGIKEYVGFWDYSQVWGDSNSLTSYNPILYYSVTTTGLILDSVLTRQRNEMIYGKFHGFSFSEKDEQPTSVIEKFEQELKLLDGVK